MKYRTPLIMIGTALVIAAAVIAGLIDEGTMTFLTLALICCAPGMSGRSCPARSA